mmetsp:Transcript_35879/g.55191  ORF Transcript_35879/g.55191 Transcript_35879/m.55191 type:complete len:507 (-) Transcript_35879:177-1697(-)
MKQGDDDKQKEKRDKTHPFDGRRGDEKDGKATSSFDFTSMADGRKRVPKIEFTTSTREEYTEDAFVEGSVGWEEWDQDEGKRALGKNFHRHQSQRIRSEDEEEEGFGMEFVESHHSTNTSDVSVTALSRNRRDSLMYATNKVLGIDSQLPESVVIVDKAGRDTTKPLYRRTRFLFVTVVACMASMGLLALAFPPGGPFNALYNAGGMLVLPKGLPIAGDLVSLYGDGLNAIGLRLAQETQEGAEDMYREKRFDKNEQGMKSGQSISFFLSAGLNNVAMVETFVNDCTEATFTDALADSGNEVLEGDVVTTGSTLFSKSYFSSPYVGRLFIMLRHPVKSVAAQYYTHREQNPTDGTTLQDFFENQIDNPIVRGLLNLSDPDTKISLENIELAKILIDKYFVAHLLEKPREAFNLFKTELGWKPKYADETEQDACEHHAIISTDNRNKFPRIIQSGYLLDTSNHVFDDGIQGPKIESWGPIHYKHWADMNLYFYLKGVVDPTSKAGNA